MNSFDRRSTSMACKSTLGLTLCLWASGQAYAQTALSAAPATKPEITAQRITALNVSQLQRQGPDAIGGIDDWFISNGTVCAVISGVNHESEFSTKGGSLVDLGFCGRADDHFPLTQDLVDGSRLRPIDAQSISIEDHQGQPSILVRSATEGVTLTTRYYFDTSQQTQLKIDKRYKRAAGDEFSFVSPLHFNLHSLEPFVFNSRNTALSNGFNNEDFVSRGVSAIKKSARTADTIITISPRNTANPIAYGWQLSRAERVENKRRTEVPFFMLADTSSTAMMVLTDTFYIGDGEKIGWLQVPQIPLLELDQGAELHTTETVFLAAKGEVAAITDQLLSDSPNVTGKIDEPNSAIHIYQDNGAPLTHITPEPDGSFQFRAPAGNYSLSAIADGARSMQTAFSVSDKTNTVLPQLTLPKASQLSLPTGDAMRLVFKGLNGTPDPDFANNLTLSSVAFDDHVVTPQPVSSLFLAGVASDLKRVTLAPGDYRVYATKGPEFSLEKTEISLKQGEAKTLSIRPPKRVISTPNFIASDLHVHSGLSFDNAFAETERVRSFVAESGEIMVASEHDLPTDYMPHINALGVADKIAAIPAAEMTSLLISNDMPHTGGHANFFPFTPKPKQYRNGMIAHEGRRLRDFIHAVKSHQHDDTDILVQLNHPRAGLTLSSKELPRNWDTLIDGGNYLDHMGHAAHPYNPHLSVHSQPNTSLIEPDPNTGVRDIDFDLIEVINPGGDEHDDRIKAVRQDWLSFLKQGFKIVGTANSDSHTALQAVAMPRTMVAIGDDRVTQFKLGEFISNLKAGNAYGTTGPMINMTLLEATMGDTFSGMRAPLKVNIEKAPWIKLTELNVQINGHTITTQTLSEQTSQQYIIPLEFEKDSFVTIEVMGVTTPDYAAIYPEVTPYAFSNPIYVDFDQDGQWQAPGL